MKASKPVTEGKTAEEKEAAYNQVINKQCAEIEALKKDNDRWRMAAVEAWERKQADLEEYVSQFKEAKPEPVSEVKEPEPTADWINLSERLPEDQVEVLLKGKRSLDTNAAEFFEISHWKPIEQVKPASADVVYYTKNLLAATYNMIDLLEAKAWERLPGKLWDLKDAYTKLSERFSAVTLPEKAEQLQARVVELEKELSDMKAQLGRVDKGEIRLEAVKKRLIKRFEKYDCDYELSEIIEIINEEIKVQPRHID